MKKLKECLNEVGRKPLFLSNLNYYYIIKTAEKKVVMQTLYKNIVPNKINSRSLVIDFCCLFSIMT